MEKCKELSTEKMEKVTGGSVYPDGMQPLFDKCEHEHKVKTGAQREDSRWVFFSQHQFEYYCLDCKKNIWVDEEPPKTE